MQPINEADAPTFTTSAPPSQDGLASWARGLLRTIAGSESAYGGRDPYTVLYGGSTFNDFTDHPRILKPIATGPNRGQKTSAAGGYQFLRNTWDEAAKATGVSDFSPASQDKAALWLAERAYKRKTGRSLEEDIQAANGDPQRLNQIGLGLSGEWTSLPGGIERNRATNSFGDRFARNLSFANTEEDGSKPALYTQGTPTMPLQIGVRPRGTDEVAPEQYVPPYNPRTSSEPPPVNFADDPLSWINGRNSAGYDIPSHVINAAAALMSVNNPKGAEQLRSLNDKPKDQFALTLSPDGTKALRVNVRTGATETIPTNFAPKPVDNPGLDAYARKEGERFSALNETISTRAGAAAGRIDQLNTLEKALENPDVWQGTGGESIHKLRSIVSRMPWIGVDYRGIADGDLAQAISRQLTVMARSQGDEKLAGAISDSDRKFLQQATASLENSPSGNKAIIDIERKKAQRERDVDNWRREYVRARGRLDAGWEDFLSAKASANPMFPAGYNARPNQSSTLPPEDNRPATFDERFPKGFKVIQGLK